MKKQSLLLVLLGLTFGSQILATMSPDEEPTEETQDEMDEEAGY